METNNRFNYGTHAVSTNSGMKRSSGDSLYTNGSSMSFPQQGKNLNGDMNVNGITTADGASQSGPHPPSSSYTHMSGHQRQDAVSYDYLWGQSQYNPAMSSGTGSGSGSASGHGMHQKPGSQGVMQQQQPQHHFQGHGQYQVNGSIGGSRQPPLAGAQYWGRGNPGQQHEGSAMPIGYNSHGIYGSYPNQVHSGLPQASHHQQPPPIQHQSAAALHHHPHHPQHQQPQHLQPPQQQHYGMVPNGIPYYSHQPQHAPLSSQQPQTPMMPTTQNFTPPQGSPQHHPIGHGGTSSPLSVQVPRMSPSAVSDSGSPQRKQSPVRGSSAHSSGVQVHMSESYKEVDEGYNGVERAPVPQRLSVGEGFTVKPPETLLPPSNDYIPRLQQPVVHAEPAKQHHDLGNLHKELSPPPASGPPPSVATPPRQQQISAALPQTVLGPTAKQSLYSSAASESASGVSAHASVVLKAGVNTSSAVAAPPPQLLTTPPLLVQGLRPVAAPVPPASASVSAALSASSATASPQMGQNCSKATPPAVSAPPSVISRSQFVAGPQSVDSPGTRGLQVPQSSISQHAPPKISTPSCAPEPPHKAMTSHLVAPSPASPLASLAPTTVDHFSLTVDSKLRSVISAPPLASETTLSQSHSSPQQSAARLPDASSTPQAFPPAPPPSSSALKSSVSSTESVKHLGDAASKVSSSSSQSPGRMVSHEAEAFVKPFSPQKSTSEPDVSPPYHKAFPVDSKQVSKQECHAAFWTEPLVKSSVSSPIITVAKQPDMDVKKSPETREDHQAAPGKEKEETLNNTMDTENYPSLTESAYTDTSGAEDAESLDDSYDVSLNNTSQAEGSSMFTDGSWANESRGWFSQDKSRRQDTTADSYLTTRSSSDDTSLQDYSQMDYSSVNDSSQNQNQTSQLSSVNEFSIHFTKVNEAEGAGAPELAVQADHTAPTLLDPGAQAGVGVPDSENGATLPLFTASCAKALKKPRKPRTPKASASPDKSSPDVKKKRRKSTPKVSKEEKMEWKKNNGEKPPPQPRKRKSSKAVSEPALVADGAAIPAGEATECITNDLSLSNNDGLSVPKCKKIKKPRVKDITAVSQSKPSEDGEDSTAGETPRRRIATEEQVNFPLLHGWRREIRVRMLEDRLKGETWYYSPCGRRMKQFPEVIKFLRRHQDNLNGVTREHFSFSPRMPVGDFYEERDTPEGKKWFLLANEEVPSMIMSITGRRGRPPNPDKEAKVRPRVGRPKGTPARRPGRPPKPKMIDLLSKIDARLLKRLEAKEELTEEEKQKLVKIKKKMKKKARMKRREDARNKKLKQEKQKAKLEGTQPTDAEMDQSVPQPPKKPGRRRKVPVPPPVEVDLEKASPVKRAATARSKAKALAKAQAEAEAQARAALAAKRQAERRAQAQKRLEERKRQQQILEELKKPAEDMCLTDHTPLPELSCIPGLALSGVTFSHCVIVVEFLHSYGKVLGLQVPKDIPSLATLQKGLLDVGNSQKELLDLLVKLMEAVLIDPGLPPYYQSVKILGEKLVDLELTHNTVSEVLRIFLESHGFELEVCNTLRTKSFQTLCPEVKASILAFLVEELNASNTVIREVDNSLENMATYRKNKWIIEGKLRKLKAALLKKTGLSEEQLSYEDRRRSTRMGVAEEESLEENSRLKRGGRRRRRPKEEPKLTEAESPNNATVPELERHIDKLTKRQVFFRKKLQQSSHSMRAMALGQDRYRRRYWLLPRIGCVLVEGAEDILASNDILVKDVPVTPVLKEVVSPVKVEVKEEPPVSAVSSDSKLLLPASPPPSHPLPPLSSLSPEVDPLPGEASLMSSPRGRGRPRKIKPEVELHLRTAKCRRRRRSSKSGGEDSVTAAGPDARMPDLTQTAFQTWLSQNQGSASAEAPALLSGAGQGGDGSQPEDGMKDMAEIRGQWFNLLPKDPCDESSLSQPCAPSSTSPVKDMPSPLNVPPFSGPLPQAVIPSPQVCSTPAPRPGRRRRRGSGAGRGHSRVGTAKRRGRPPSSLLQEIEQKYFTQLVVKPIPLAMVKGWWWIKDPEELTAILTALNPRGVREKVLHKHLSKHMEFLSELCTRPITDPIFQQKGEDGGNLMNLTQQPWEAQDRAMQIDLGVLQLVEDLEQRVVGADLQLKMAPPNGQSDTESAADASTAGFQMYTIPEPDSTRDDLQYYEHEADPRDDWMVKIKKEWSDLLRVPSNPLDLGVLRLTNLERNIERRYLKDPLWNLSEVVRLAPLTPPPGEEEVPMDAVSMESEITPRLMLWRQALDRCRSASQLALCLLQLERAIAWEKSIVRVTCQFCRKGDNDECLLLCDGCDRGWHMFCLKPKVTEVPEGDWFCPNCIAKGIGEGPRSPRSARQRTNARKRRFVYGAEASDEEEGQKRNTSTRQKDSPTPSSATSQSLSKRRRMATRNQPDLTYCEIILMEMEAHADAWPFLEPVNPRLVPGYRRIVKNPMDFLTMREKLLQGGYCSCEEFAADAQLVFNNCELFNEDSSEVGVAGHSMRRFFESRWAEFYSNGD